MHKKSITNEQRQRLIDMFGADIAAVILELAARTDKPELAPDVPKRLAKAHAEQSTAMQQLRFKMASSAVADNRREAQRRASWRDIPGLFKD